MYVFTYEKKKINKNVVNKINESKSNVERTTTGKYNL